MVRSGKLLNNSITVQDSRNAIQIYGVDLGVLKGRLQRIKQVMYLLISWKSRNQ